MKYISQDLSVAPIRIDIYLGYIGMALDAIEPFVISIKSKEVAESFQNYFETL